MAVGAGYHAGGIRQQWLPLGVSSLVQFLGKPLIAWQLSSLTGLTAEAASVATLLFCVPTAPSVYILSRQLGGDCDSMATLITGQTILSLATLPMTLMLIT